MAGGRKRKEDEYEKEASEEDVLPSKKVAKSSKESDDIVVCEISKNRRVSVRNWQGKTWIDIREFYMKNGQQLPGKKGISLSVDQWKIICDHAKDIDNALASQ